MKIKLILILLITLLTLGCTRQSGPNEPDVIEYHKGTEGLEMKFIDGLPGEEVWVGSDFIIGLDLRNKGSSDINDGVLVLSGFDPLYIEAKEYEFPFALEGKSISHPEGDYELAKFKVTSKYIPEGSDEFNLGFTIRAYYEYETEATANVCIDSDIYDFQKTEEKGCDISKLTLSGGQGAPLALTYVEEEIVPFGDITEIQFKLKIENKGNGEVVGDINLNEVKLSNNRINCNLKEDKNDKEKIIICKTSVEKVQGAYIAPLTVRLTYTYTQKLDKSIKIRSLTS